VYVFRRALEFRERCDGAAGCGGLFVVDFEQE
jgi:hypothetical protein